MNKENMEREKKRVWDDGVIREHAAPIPFETENRFKRIGLEAIYAIKASTYHTYIEDGRLLTLDCVLGIGEHFIDPNLPEDDLFIMNRARNFAIDRLTEQAEEVGKHLIARFAIDAKLADVSTDLGQ